MDVFLVFGEFKIIFIFLNCILELIKIFVLVIKVFKYSVIEKVIFMGFFFYMFRFFFS